MSISAISADANVRRASYPPLAPIGQVTASATTADGGPLQVEIPAPAEEKIPVKAFRSAKGETRNDAAAPPTADQASDNFSFADFIDVINPLQHIPGINLAYQRLTGDTIKPAENVMGGFLYGGALGGMAAMAMSAMTELWNGSATDSDGTTALAQTSPNKFGGAAVPGAAA